MNHAHRSLWSPRSILTVILAPALLLGTLVAAAPLPLGPGGPSAAQAAPVREVQAPTFVQMVGQLHVDRVLSVNLGQWTPSVTNLQMSYVWKRNGNAIPGATNPTYKLTSADFDQLISVEVVGSYGEWLPGMSISVQKRVGIGTLDLPTAVTVEDSTPPWELPPVGSLMRVVTTGKFEPEPVGLTYNWMYNGVSVPDSNSHEHRIRPDALNKQVSVTINGAKTYYLPASVTGYGRMVTEGTIWQEQPARITDAYNFRYLSTATVTPPIWHPMPTENSMSYQWIDESGTVLGTTRAYTPKLADIGKKIRIRATGMTAGYKPFTAEGPAYEVKRATMSCSAPTILGEVKAGQKVTADPGRWFPATTSFRYEWRLDNKLVGTDGEYTIPWDSAGEHLSVAAIGEADSYEPCSRASSQVLVTGGKFTSTEKPQISGAHRVGQELSATSGGWQPSGEYAFQWLREGQEIPGATAAKYTVTPEDGTHLLSVRVTATRNGYDDGVAVSDAVQILLEDYETSSTPTIVGDPKVGHAITADVGEWSPAPQSFAYQWLRDGWVIPGGTKSSYTPEEADSGYPLSVRITPTKAGYSSQTLTSEAKTVAPADPGTRNFTRIPQPAITGILKVGHAVFAEAGSWEPWPARIDYQWLRNGTAIRGATTSSYTPTMADLDQSLSVRVIASKPGYFTMVRTSIASKVAAATPGTLNFDQAPLPTVEGDPAVGESVTALTGYWSPEPDQYSYQWLRDDTVIRDAKSSSYEPVDADRGRQLSVRVTASKNGYYPTARVSVPKKVATSEFTDAPTPTISGIAKVGDELTAQAGSWTPEPEDLAYQWLLGGDEITGATNEKYTPVANDAGKELSVRVTATKTGYTETIRTSTAQTVADADPELQDFTTAPAPTLQGTAKVGTEILARPGTWEPRYDTLEYQWLLGGNEIDGAIGARYTPVATDAGQELSVRVKAIKAGYNDTVRTSAVQTVAEADPVLLDFTTAPDPTFDGQAKVGVEVTAQAGDWEPNPSGFAYQWLLDGDEIDGATNEKYTPVPNDTDKELSVRVTATLDGYTPTSRTSAVQTVAEADPVLLDFEIAPDPTLSGEAKVGNEITAVPGFWVPNPGPTGFAYQWLLGGDEIDGATEAKYTPVANDAGKELSVRVTATLDGYNDTVRTSAVQTVAGADPELQEFANAPTPTIQGAAKVGVEVTAQAGDWEPNPTGLAYQWLIGGDEIDGATNERYTPVANDADKELSVRVTATLDGYTPTTRTSAVQIVAAATDPVPLDFISAPFPTIDGQSRVGVEITARTGDWEPTPSGFAYQWLIGGDEIDGATEAKYTPVANDAGKRLSVRVTATLDGYNPTTRTSAAQTVGGADPELQEFTTAPTPTIQGAAKVGVEVTAQAGDWEPNPTGLAYQWLIGGQEIDGATDEKYTPVATDADKELSVRVTATLDGYTPTTRTSAVQTVAEADPVLLDFDIAPDPTLSGEAKVGNEISAVPGFWVPNPGPTGLAYQWLLDGDEIDGATNEKYTPVPNDADKELSVRVTATLDGYRPTTRTSAVQTVAEADPILLDFTTAPAPTIDGQAKVGVEVTAQAGDWEPNPTGLAYQWLIDGDEIDGATNEKYTPVPNDADKELSVRVTATLDGYNDTVRTSAFQTVAAADPELQEFDQAPTPGISGAVRVDGTVTAAPGDWEPDPDGFAYQWLLDGDEIPGAVASAYSPVASDEGAKLSVRVTATLDGYTPTTRVSAEHEVLSSDPSLTKFISAPNPTVSVTGGGLARVGAELTAAPGTWEPDPDDFEYQWERNGIQISGATDAKYTPVAADAGKHLSVWVTAIKSGYHTTMRVSIAHQIAEAEPEPELLDFDAAPAPTVSGTPRVGVKLTAVPNRWTPTPDALAYQWLRDGIVITSATSSAYTPIPADAGKRLSVRVTATRTGYNETTRISTAQVVAPATPVVLKLTATPKPKISGKAKVGKKLAVKAGTWKPAKVTLKYRWLRNGKVIKGATKSKYKITKKDRGKRISVRVTGTKKGYVTVTKTSSSKRIPKARR